MGRGEVTEKVPAAKPARDTCAAVLVSLRRQRNRTQRGSLRQRRFDDARVEDEEHPITARPAAVREGLEKRSEINRREPAVAFGDPAEIPELAADFPVGSRRSIPPVDVNQFARKVWLGARALLSCLALRDDTSPVIRRPNPGRQSAFRGRRRVRPSGRHPSSPYGQAAAPARTPSRTRPARLSTGRSRVGPFEFADRIYANANRTDYFISLRCPTRARTMPSAKKSRPPATRPLVPLCRKPTRPRLSAASASGTIPFPNSIA